MDDWHNLRLGTEIAITIEIRYNMFTSRPIHVESIGAPMMIYRNLPNALTFSRLMAPLVIVGFIGHARVVFWVIVVALITDFADGPIARRYATSSDFGAQLDTYADLILAAGVVVGLALVSRPPVWLIAVIGGVAIALFGVRAAGRSRRAQNAVRVSIELLFLTIYGAAVVGFAIRAYGWHPYIAPATAMAVTALAWFYRGRIRNFRSQLL